MTEVADEVFLPDGLGPFAWYVVRDGRRATVVDAGWPGHWPRLVTALQALGLQVRDVEGVVVTHAHSDHLGFAERLASESGSAVHVHEAEVDLVRRRLFLPWPGLLRDLVHAHDRWMVGHALAHGLLRATRVRSATGHPDGAVLDLPGSPVLVHVPGHTPGSAVVHLPARRALLTGDALVTQSLVTGERGGPQLVPGRLTGDLGGARSSLDRLRGLGEVSVLPGHGAPWTGPLDTALDGARAQQRP